MKFNVPVPNVTVPNPPERFLTVLVGQHHCSYVSTIHYEQWDYTWANVVPSNPNGTSKTWEVKIANLFGNPWVTITAVIVEWEPGKFQILYCPLWDVTLTASWLTDLQWILMVLFPSRHHHPLCYLLFHTCTTVQEEKHTQKSRSFNSVVIVLGGPL